MNRKNIVLKAEAVLAAFHEHFPDDGKEVYAKGGLRDRIDALIEGHPTDEKQALVIKDALGRQAKAVFPLMKVILRDEFFEHASFTEQRNEFLNAAADPCIDARGFEGEPGEPEDNPDPEFSKDEDTIYIGQTDWAAFRMSEVEQNDASVFNLSMILFLRKVVSFKKMILGVEEYLSERKEKAA